MSPESRIAELEAERKAIRTCRHGRSWLVLGGLMEWCSFCGAFRRMERVDATGVRPAERWTRPNNERSQRWVMDPPAALLGKGVQR